MGRGEKGRGERGEAGEPNAAMGMAPVSTRDGNSTQGEDGEITFNVVGLLAVACSIRLGLGNL